MLTPDEKQFLRDTTIAADKAGHIFPAFAACEAALESTFGRSELARLDLNLFGMKQHIHPIYGTHVLPTREFENGEWETISSSWIHYPSTSDCFADRMATLKRLASVYPHYSAALAATDGEKYVTEVSRTWSSDPARAAKVLAIYENGGDWSAIA